VHYPNPEKLFLVLGLFLSGRISAGKAVELLGLRVDGFYRLFTGLGIEYSIYYDEEEVLEMLTLAGQAIALLLIASTSLLAVKRSVREVACLRASSP